MAKRLSELVIKVGTKQLWICAKTISHQKKKRKHYKAIFNTFTCVILIQYINITSNDIQEHTGAYIHIVGCVENV